MSSLSDQSQAGSRHTLLARSAFHNSAQLLQQPSVEPARGTQSVRVQPQCQGLGTAGRQLLAQPSNSEAVW